MVILIMVIIMNKSYYEYNINKKNYKKIDKDIHSDIVIIGGGLTGITLAYLLKDSGYDISIIEENQIGSQTSGHTTAKITYLHALIYYELAHYYNKKIAYMYYKSNKEALQMIEDIINKEKIDCDYKKNKSIIYTNDIKIKEKMIKQKQLLESFGEKVEESSQDYLYSISLDNQAIFHPLKYLYSLLSRIDHKIHIYENSKVIKINRGHEFELEVNHHKVTCDYVVHATRYPFIYKGLYFSKLIQKQEYVYYLDKQDSHNSLLCLDQSLSYRPIDNGSIHIGNDKGLMNWFAEDSISLRIIPYIKELSYDEYIAYGYNKWGMTMSMVAAKLINDYILNIDNPYSYLYGSSHYSYQAFKDKMPMLIRNMKKGFIDNRKCDNSELKMNEGKIMKINHRLVAVYRDKQGYHYFSPYCPHLKCIIEFNKKTKCWNCPCHGSIFDAYGHLMIGPSLYDLKEK